MNLKLGKGLLYNIENPFSLKQEPNTEIIIFGGPDYIKALDKILHEYWLWMNTKIYDKDTLKL